MAGKSDHRMARSSQGPTRARTRLPALLLAAALLVAHAPAAVGAIAFVKNVGADGNANTDTSISITVPAGGVAFGNTIIVSFAMDPAAGAVTCTDSKGNSYSVAVDRANGSGTSGAR